MPGAETRTQSNRQPTSPGSSRGTFRSIRLSLLLAVVLAIGLGPAVLWGGWARHPVAHPHERGARFNRLLRRIVIRQRSCRYMPATMWPRITSSCSCRDPRVSRSRMRRSTQPPCISTRSPPTPLSGSPLSFNTFPNTDFIASDEKFAPPNYRTVNPQDFFGLASVSYSVASTASGTATLTIADTVPASTLPRRIERRSPSPS